MIGKYLVKNSCDLRVNCLSGVTENFVEKFRKSIEIKISKISI